MYERGEGVKQSASTAAEWYRKSAEQGDATGQYNLAMLYLDGNGVEKDKQNAIVFFKLSAEQGDEDAADELKKLGVSP